MRDCLQTLDVFILPSHQEGLCIAALEAMACGVPVVSTRCGGPEEFVVPDVTGYLVEAQPQEMARAVAAIISEPDLRSRLSVAARRLVEQRYARAPVEAAFGEALKACFQELGGPRAAAELKLTRWLRMNQLVEPLASGVQNVPAVAHSHATFVDQHRKKPPNQHEPGFQGILIRSRARDSDRTPQWVANARLARTVGISRAAVGSGDTRYQGSLQASRAGCGMGHHPAVHDDGDLQRGVRRTLQESLRMASRTPCLSLRGSCRGRSFQRRSARQASRWSAPRTWSARSTFRETHHPAGVRGRRPAWT